MTAEKAILDALFSKPPDQYGEEWARHFRKRLADLGWLVVRAADAADDAVVAAAMHNFLNIFGKNMSDLSRWEGNQHKDVWIDRSKGVIKAYLDSARE